MQNMQKQLKKLTKPSETQIFIWKKYFYLYNNKQKMNKQSSKQEQTHTKSTAIIALRIAYTLIVVTILIGAIVIAYIFKGKLHLFSIGIAEIGLYGAIIFSFLLLQQLFSILNNYKWIPSLIEKSDKTPKVGLQVVGYREDKKLFKVCLDSIKKQDYPSLHQVIVGIDGNEQTDLIMESVFKQVFPFGRILRLEKVLEDMDQDQISAIRETTKNDRFICISQPHKGKRDIMYTCFHCHSQETELVALTDSDTFWNIDTLTNLVSVMVGHDNYRAEENEKDLDRAWLLKKEVKQCGAVTGDVGIWNKQNYLSFLTSLRYWFAFNVQRAADSYFGVVNCVSGPLGLYRKETLQDISHQWIKQEFLGEKCTYGDDRSLSNYILLRGMAIFYNNKAFVQTDTPAQLLRWIPQQTRWCKSFYRQFMYNIKSFYMHSAWMAVELVFQFIYPFFIIITLVYFITNSLDDMMIVFFFLVFMGTFRGLFGFLRTGQLRFLHYGIYVFLYILCLIPSKLWAIITLWNNDWGTSSRFQRYQNYIKAIHAIVWSIAFVIYIGVFMTIYLIQDQKINPITAYGALGAFCFIVILIGHWTIWGNFFLIPDNEQLMQMRYQQAGVQKTVKTKKSKESGDTSQKHLNLNDQIKVGSSFGSNSQTLG